MHSKYLSPDVLVVIANYDFSSNADLLKDRFGMHFKTISIDSSSPTPPRNVDFIIPNKYYPGLWNAAVKEAISNGYQWLMFVASDLQIRDVDLLCGFAAEAINLNEIGVWAPSVSSGSRVAFPILLNRASSGIRESGVVEGFFFLTRTKILKSIYPIPDEFRYGWAVDVLTCHKSYQADLLCVVDDRVQIYHPQSKSEHQIDANAANSEWPKFIRPEVLQQSNLRQKRLSNQVNLINKFPTKR
jgi:hypothetical protein